MVACLPTTLQDNSKLLIAQVKAHTDPKLRWKVACQIIKDKTGVEIPNGITTYKELMHHEAVVAEKYWVDYANRVEGTGTSLKFGCRVQDRQSNKNPNNEISCALNYLYGFLQNALILKSIMSVGLNPSISFLHELKKQISTCIMT
jgi:CRISPR/Cas system-associated endonuclease Cas1